MLLWLAAAYLAGYWLSQWFAPRPMAAPPSSLASPLAVSGSASMQAAESLEQMLTSTAATPPAALEASEVKLSGVMMAGPQSTIIAAVNGGKPQVFELGEPLSASLRLHEVRASSAVLRRSDGSLVVVELPERETLLR